MPDGAVLSAGLALTGAAALLIRTPADAPRLTARLLIAGLGAAAVLRGGWTGGAPVAGLLAIDAAAFVLLAALAWKAERGWVAPALALQALALMASLAGGVDPQITPAVHVAVSHGAAAGAGILLSAGAALSRLTVHKEKGAALAGSALSGRPELRMTKLT